MDNQNPMEEETGTSPDQPIKEVIHHDQSSKKSLWGFLFLIIFLIIIGLIIF